MALASDFMMEHGWKLERVDHLREGRPTNI